VYWGLRAGIALSRLIPLSVSYRLGMVGGEAVYWCWPSKRRNTRLNMAVIASDPDAGPQAAALARASLRNYGRYVIDFLNLPNLPAEEIVRRIRVQGWEHLDRAMESGRGAIFVTGHFGLWDYAPVVVASRYPGKVHVVAEPFSSDRLDRLIQGQRAAKGATVIPMTGVRQMIRTLRSNNILALLVDRPVQNDGVPITFFGRPTMVPAGAATLAAITGATILPGYMMHCEDGGYEGVIMPPVEVSATGDREQDVRCTTQAVFSALEQFISRYPHYWYMFRDMWGLAASTTSQVEVTA
jgi:KDO2-lipid IV(A) lauroyltransferase